MLFKMLQIEAAVGASNDHTPRYDVIGSVCDPAAVFHRMMSDLNVSLLSFDYVSEQSELLRTLRMRPKGLLYQIDFCEDSPYVDCALGWDDYWARLGSTRSLWVRRERKLMGQQGAVLRCLTNWQEVDALLTMVYEVEASGWKGREGTAIKQRPETLMFYNRCLRHWAESGVLRLFTLWLREELIAFQIWSATRKSSQN